MIFNFFKNTLFSPKNQRRVLFLFGAGFIYMGGGDFHSAWKSKSWPSTSGVITQLKTDSKSKEKITTIQYEYQLSNKTYQGHQLSFGKKEITFEELQTYDSKLKIGKSIKVYYNPDKNKVSVLQPGIILKNFYKTVVGTLSVSFAVIILWLKFVIRRLLFGLFLITVGSGPLFKGGEELLRAIRNKEKIPMKSSASSLFGGSLALIGGRGCKRSFKDLLKSKSADS